MGNRLCTVERQSPRIFSELRNQTYNSGFNYIVKARYVPCGSGEMLLRQGDIVKVIRQSDDDQYLFVERFNEVK